MVVRADRCGFGATEHEWGPCGHLDRYSLFMMVALAPPYAKLLNLCCFGGLGLGESLSEGNVEFGVDCWEQVTVGAQRDVDRRVAHAFHHRSGMRTLGDEKLRARRRPLDPANSGFIYQREIFWGRS